MTRRNSPDIERTREQLGDTVGALTARLDAKAQARATAPRLKKPGRGCDGPGADRVKTSPPRQQLAGKTGPDHGGRGWAPAAGSAGLVADAIAGRAPEVEIEGLGVDRLVHR